MYIEQNIDPQGTAFLQSFAKQYIPMMDFCDAKITCLTKDQAVIKIALNPDTQNHLKSMYIGALIVGADCASGLLAMHIAKDLQNQLQLVFKDCHADFHKRADADVYFTCDDGPAIQSAVEHTQKTLERVNLPVTVYARLLDNPSEPAATITLTLSIKYQP